MMTTYSTGNPLGSTDPRDLYDNSENLDYLVNGNQPAYNDRLGNARKSWSGIEEDFQDFLSSSGYVGTDTDGAIQDYASGIELTSYNQIIRDGGEFWRLSASEDLPYTTDGSGIPEGGSFVSVGDATLRQDLAADTGAGLVGTESGDTLQETLDANADAINQRTIYVGSVAESLYNVDGVDGAHYNASSWREGQLSGGGAFVFDASGSVDDHDGIYRISPSVPPVSAQSGATLADRLNNFRAGTGEENPGATGVFVKVKENLKNLDIAECGALNDEDATSAMVAGKSVLNSLGGGILYGLGRYYLESNISIDEDNIIVAGGGPGVTVFERTDPSVSGFMFQWADNNNTEGGGLIGCTLKGIRNPDTGNAGVAFGTAVNYANRWTSYNILCDSWGQYGYAIYNGDEWNCSKIRVINHGHTDTAISSCMGFNVYPKLASQGGRLHDVYSEIAPDTIANSAAIKLQVHADLDASKLYAKGGSEQCFNIDSISGFVRGVIVRAVTSNTGLVVGNSNSSHYFRGEFTLDGVDCDDSGFDVSFAITGQSVGVDEPSLLNCTIKNIEAGSFRALTRSAIIGCTLENIYCSGSVRLDPEEAGGIAAPTTSNNNQYVNLKTSSYIKLLEMNSTIEGITSKGSNGIIVDGDNNIIVSATSRDSGGNGFTIDGDSNVLSNLTVAYPSGRNVWVRGGSNNVIAGLTVGGTLLDNGTGTDTSALVQV